MIPTILIQDVGTGHSMNESLKNNRNLKRKRKRLSDIYTHDDYDGSRPLEFNKKKRNKSELMELDLEMKRYRTRSTIIQVVIFSVAIMVTAGIFKYLFF